MNYFLFIDESGDDKLNYIDPKYPILNLCGIVTSKNQYGIINHRLNKLKMDIWGTEDVILHKSEIDKRKKYFRELRKENKNRLFCDSINDIISTAPYLIISSVILKQAYVDKYPENLISIYEKALEFIIERAVFYLDSQPSEHKRMYFVLEQRGKREDGAVEDHFKRVFYRGTYYVTASRLQRYNFVIKFYSKKENINGLQLSDQIAKTIGRYSLNQVENNDYRLFKDKFYKKGRRVFGLKIFP